MRWSSRRSRPLRFHRAEIAKLTKPSPTSLTLVEFTHRVPIWPEAVRLPNLVRTGFAPPSAATINGTVIVDAVVDEKSRVIHGSVFPAFPVEDWKFNTARSVVEHYEFTPYLVNGCAVKVYMTIPIRFGHQ